MYAMSLPMFDKHTCKAITYNTLLMSGIVTVGYAGSFLMEQYHKSKSENESENR